MKHLHTVENQEENFPRCHAPEEYMNADLISLSVLSSEDICPLATLFSDETVGQSYMVPDYESRSQWEELAARIVALSADDSRYVRGIRLGDGLIGLINDVGIEGGSLELGWSILPQRQGKGYGTKALSLAIEELFQKGFEEVWAGAFDSNLPSIRIMEKCGMRKMEKTEMIAYRGREHRCVYYVRYKEDT